MPLRDFFVDNHHILLFVYGQVFFVMGLAIALQSRRYSRLDLSRSLSWLALFGIVHGLYEWGDLFIPLQVARFSPPLIRVFSLTQLIALGVSYACLFQFGISLLRTILSQGMAASLRWLPLAILSIWLVAIFFVLLPLTPDFVRWQMMSNAFARYFIGFPGALLAAYGLRRHTQERIAPLGVPHIERSLRVAGVLLVLYGIFGGLIVPPVPFFPGHVLNTTAFYEFSGIPALLFRSLIGLLLAITVIRALEIFDLETERIIESMEQQQIVNTERERIGRDLHDGAIQLVYTAGLLVESAYKQSLPATPIHGRLEKAVAVLNDAITALRRNLAELHTTPVGGSLSEGLKHVARDPRFTTFVDVHVEADALADHPLSEGQTDHVISVVNEALSNVVRHARAQHVTVRAACDQNQLRLSILDDGIGIVKEAHTGYGLRNMHDRARLLGGSLDVSNADKRGTLVTLIIPWSDER